MSTTTNNNTKPVPVFMAFKPSMPPVDHCSNQQPQAKVALKGAQALAKLATIGMRT